MADERRPDEQRPVEGGPEGGRRVDTGGGGYVEGGVETGGGDLVGGDKVVYGLDVERLVAALQQALPANDPLPALLMETLRRFQSLHTQLYEWKELHNALSEIANDLPQFARMVERLELYGERLDSHTLRRSWRPVGQRLALLLVWAREPRVIDAEPFAETPSGLQGPAWAVELAAGGQRLQELVEQRTPDSAELYEATFDFSDAVERRLFLADRALRETANELYLQSRLVLGNLGQDDER